MPEHLGGVHARECLHVREEVFIRRDLERGHQRPEEVVGALSATVLVVSVSVTEDTVLTQPVLMRRKTAGNARDGMMAMSAEISLADLLLSR